MQNLDEGSARAVFTVPAPAGNYAPEELYFKVLETDKAEGLYRKIRALRILVENLIATAVVEVWALRHGGDVMKAADWINTGISHNLVGMSALIELAATTKVKLRAKSGGTGGNMAVSAFWS
jgi:hypothetical protein